MRFPILLLVPALAFVPPALADFDPAGKPVAWDGQIITQIRHSEDTCFRLRASRRDRQSGQPEIFVACSFGIYPSEDYAPGNWLRARGILQPEAFDNLPWVAAAGVRPIAAPYNPMVDDPMAGPWFDPAWPMMEPWGNPFMQPWGMYPYPSPWIW